MVLSNPGADHASLESPSLWQVGPVRASFSLDPNSFTSEGPHRLILAVRVRTPPCGPNIEPELEMPPIRTVAQKKALASIPGWNLRLPHIPFAFEFDARLRVDSLFALPDESRARNSRTK